MSEDQRPKTVREAIRVGISGVWTKELEDSLFWPIAEFVDQVYKNGYKKGRLDELEDLRQAGILPSTDVKREMEK